MNNSDIKLNAVSHRDTTYIQTQGPPGIKSIFPSHQPSSHATAQISSVQCSTSVDTGLFQKPGEYLEFVIPARDLRIERLSLEVTVRNASLGNIIITTAFQMVKKIDYFAGTTFLGSLDGLSGYFKHTMLLTDEHIMGLAEYTNVAVSEGIFNSYRATLTPGTTRVMMMPCTEMLHGLVPGFLSGALRMQVFLNTEGGWTSGSDSIEVAGARLMMESALLGPAEAEEVRDVYRSGQLTHRYHEARLSRTLMSMVPGTKYRIPLQGLCGDFSVLWIASMLPITTFAWATTTRDDIAQLYITDTTNQITLGGTILDTAFLRYQHATAYPSSFLMDNFVYPLTASRSGYKDLVTGAHTGSLALTAKGETLNITTGSFTAPDYDRNLTIIGFAVCALRVNANGTVTAFR